jgi:hypothetical protein
MAKFNQMYMKRPRFEMLEYEGRKVNNNMTNESMLNVMEDQEEREEGVCRTTSTRQETKGR